MFASTGVAGAQAGRAAGRPAVEARSEEKHTQHSTTIYCVRRARGVRFDSTTVAALDTVYPSACPSQ